MTQGIGRPSVYHGSGAVPGLFQCTAETCLSGKQKRTYGIYGIDMYKYFTDALVAMSRSSGVEEDVADLRKVHRLIQRVHSVVPDLLLNVIPQLEEEMKLNDDTVRLVSIETIGAMLAEPNSSLFQEYPSVWKTWLGR